MTSPSASKRSFASSTSPSISSPPTKRRRTSPFRSSETSAAAATPGILSTISNWCQGFFGKAQNMRGDPQTAPHHRKSLRDGSRQSPLAKEFAHPRGSAALLEETPVSPTANRRCEVIELSDDDESQSDSNGTDDRVAWTYEARLHLNDLNSLSSIHPNLPAPLFTSSFNTSSARIGTTLPNGSVDGSSNASRRGLPDLSCQKPEREYPWAESQSSTHHASQSSKGSSRQSSNRVRRQKSSRRMASGVEPHMDSLVKSAQRTGDANVAAFQRVRDELQTTPSRPKSRKDRRDLTTSLNSLSLGTRPTLDESVRRGKEKPTYVPASFVSSLRKQRRPFSVLRREVVEKLKQEIEDEEKRVQNRLRIPIPSDITLEQASIVDARLRDSQFLASLGSGEVNATSLRRLRPNVWLNDDVVNFYAELINQRAKKEERKVFCMNSYLYQKLSEQGYQKANLKRWTKRMKLDIFELDKLLIPINVSNAHWVCAVVNFQKRQIEYYDSLPDTGYRLKVFKILREYLEAEHMEKKASSFDFTDWVNVYSNKTPQQDNGSDCGVFACQTLESSARGRDLVKDGFQFSSKNMAFFRRLMVVEIASNELAKRLWDMQE